MSDRSRFRPRPAWALVLVLALASASLIGIVLWFRSGDGLFGDAAASLAARGVYVTVVSRRGSLAQGLARVARDVIYLDGPLTAVA